MAEVRMKNKKYAVVNSKGEIPLVKKMSVADHNIFPYSQCRELVAKMSSGDILCVASVNCFATGVYDLLSKFQCLSSRGIEFQSAQEKYLNFSIINPLSHVTLESIRILAQHEYEFTQMIRNSKLNVSEKEMLIQRIQSEFLTCLCVMFRNNGIRKRGN